MTTQEAPRDKMKLVFAVIVLVLGATLWFTMVRGREETGAPTQAFFTVDDGATFFSADSKLIPPFDHQGKPAVGAMVYTTDGGKTKQVGSLYRYTEAGKKMMEESRKSAAADFGRAALDAIEVKKPRSADATWVKTGDPRALEVQRPPVGPNVEQVLP